jgi:hypothetical protein
VFLAGIAIPNDRVLELARLVDDADLAARLNQAVVEDDKVVALETHERRSILLALEHAPEAGFDDLRSTLLQEGQRRRAGGH